MCFSGKRFGVSLVLCVGLRPPGLSLVHFGIFVVVLVQFTFPQPCS